MNELGKAEEAFGASVANGATKTARAAFGPGGATGAAGIPSANPQVGTGPLGAPANADGALSMSDALKGTYEQLKSAADATARRYLRFGTKGAANTASIADVAGSVVPGMKTEAAPAKTAPVQKPAAQDVPASAPQTAQTAQPAAVEQPAQPAQPAPQAQTPVQAEFLPEVRDVNENGVSRDGIFANVGGVDTEFDGYGDVNSMKGVADMIGGVQSIVDRFYGRGE